jgi:hypothetical protein
MAQLARLCGTRAGFQVTRMSGWRMGRLAAEFYQAEI